MLSLEMLRKLVLENATVLFFFFFSKTFCHCHWPHGQCKIWNWDFFEMLLKTEMTDFGHHHGGSKVKLNRRHTLFSLSIKAIQWPDICLITCRPSVPAVVVTSPRLSEAWSYFCMVFRRVTGPASLFDTETQVVYWRQTRDQKIREEAKRLWTPLIHASFCQRFNQLLLIQPTTNAKWSLRWSQGQQFFTRH